MVRIDTPVQSDDDFDLVYSADSVSEMSDSEAPRKQPQPDLAATSSHTVVVTGAAPPALVRPGSERLTGPHEVPVMPFSAEHDGELANLSQEFSEHSIRNESAGAPSSSLSRGSGTTKSRINDGLQYTKSMYNKFWHKDALIAVMGMTGSGKTTFISKVTGRDDLRIGHDLTSCTRDIQVVDTKIDGQTVHFVDTPGFSDTHLSDTEILQMIADYLAVAYKQEMKLSGIIYIHPISDNRVTHHATKNLDMFRKLTGEKNLKNVVLATSMWDKVSAADGARREQELKSKFWPLFLAMGARAVRHDDTAASARAIVASMLVANKPFYLQLQEELGKDNKALRDTAAGREVMLDLVRMKEEHQRELAEMEALIRSSARESESVIEAMQAHYQGRLSELERTLRDERRMNEEAVRSLKDRVQALEKRGSGCIVM